MPIAPVGLVVYVARVGEDRRMPEHPPHVPDEDHDDPATRVPIGDAAADDDAPSGLPDERRRPGDTDEDPGAQETG
jgi:hypothetical protein